MKKRLSLNCIFLFVFLLFSSIDVCYAYSENDLPYELNKNFRFSIDQIESEDIKRIYNVDNTTIPSYFNLNDYLKQKYNINIPVGNQVPFDLCAAFSSLKSVETNYALKKGKYVDLSERHVDYMASQYFYDKNRVPGTGIAQDYIYTLFETFGAVTEYEVPYKDYSEDEYLNFKNINPLLKLNSTIMFPNMNYKNYSGLDLNLRNRWLNIIKIHLMKYGSVGSGLSAPNGADTFNDQTSAYYYKSGATGAGGGHGVSIIGWDDNYSKNNFIIKPEHDGAFIVLNSWGDKWGDNGYFYVSYDDENFLAQVYGVLDVTESRNYNFYTYSQKLFNTSGGFFTSQSRRIFKSFGLKFDKGDEIEFLSHITANIGVHYNDDVASRIRYYLNPIDDTFDKTKMIYLGSTTSIVMGNVTNISLNNPIKLQGNKFSIVIEVECEDLKCGWTNSIDFNNNSINGNMYNANGFDEYWEKIDTEFPVFVATVKDKLPVVEISRLPDKIVYNKKDKLNLAGGVINVLYDNGQPTEIPMTSNLIRILEYDSNAVGWHEVMLNYDGAVVKFDVYTNDVESIEIKKLPNKLVYNYGESVDLTGGILSIKYDNGSISDVIMTSDDVKSSKIDFSINGLQEITLNYDGKTTTFDITFIKPISRWVNVKSPDKTSYLIGEQLDLTGGIITVEYNDLSTEDIPMTSNEVSVSGFNSNLVGGQVVYVSYREKTSIFLVNVENSITSIGIGHLPNKVAYKKGENLDLTGGKIIVTYSNNSTEEILMCDDVVTVSGYDKNTLGTQELTITYKSKTAKFSVSVYNISYTVTFNSDGGSSVASQTINYNGKATKPSNPTKTGYTFKEWQLNGSTYDFNTAVTGNITLKAVWTINQYTVTFNSDGGSSVAGQTINYNGKTTKPSNPTKTGYTFKEWQLNGSTYDFNTAVTGNITLKAVWTINQYTVTFNSDGGSSVAGQTINYNGKATKPSNPTKTEYTFKEWQLNGSTYDFNTPIASNITLTAVWDKNEVIDVGTVTLKNTLENNGYSVNGNLTSKFTLGDSIATIKNKLGNDVMIESKTDIISTGTVIKKENESYIVVIKGDLNSDGKINSGDLLQMRKYLLEEINLAGAYKEAGIIESVGNIKSLDLLRLRQYLLGEYTFK